MLACVCLCYFRRTLPIDVSPSVFALVVLFHAYLPAQVSKTTSASGIRINKGCSKCGIFKQSGKLSCCARGGAWFKNCGNAGDAHFDHTWFEGIQACKSKSRDSDSWLLHLHYGGYVFVDLSLSPAL